MLFINLSLSLSVRVKLELGINGETDGRQEWERQEEIDNRRWIERDWEGRSVAKDEATEDVGAPQTNGVVRN